MFIHFSEKAEECLKWVQKNHDKPEVDYTQRHEDLGKEIERIEVIQKVYVEKKTKKDLKSLLATARDFMMNNDHEKALENYKLAFRIALKKKNVESAVFCALKISEVCCTGAKMMIKISKKKNSVEKAFEFFLFGTHQLIYALHKTKEQFEDTLVDKLYEMKSFLTDTFPAVTNKYDYFDYINLFVRSCYHSFDIRTTSERYRAMVSSMLRLLLNEAIIMVEDVPNCVMVKTEVTNLLRKIEEPIENLAFIEKCEIEISNDTLSAEEYKECFEKTEGVAKSINTLNESRQLFTSLDTKLEDLTENDVSIALNLLDDLENIKKYTIDHIKILCQIQLLEGNIFLKLILDDDAAKQCYR